MARLRFVTLAVLGGSLFVSTLTVLADILDSREELAIALTDRAAVVTLFFAPVLCRFFSAHVY